MKRLASTPKSTVRLDSVKLATTVRESIKTVRARANGTQNPESKRALRRSEKPVASKVNGANGSQKQALHNSLDTDCSPLGHRTADRVSASLRKVEEATRQPTPRDGQASPSPALLNGDSNHPALGDSQQLLEQLDCAVITFDVGGKIQLWNRTATEIFGYTASEMIGASSLVLTPHECVDEAKLWKERVRAGEVLEQMDTTRLRKNGTRVQVRVSAYPLRDHHHQIVGTWSFIRDRTGEKLAQESDDLIAKLAHVRDEERSRMARDLHDGTGQLLTVITSNLQLLARIQSKRTPSRVASVLEDTLALVEEVSREIRINAYLARPPQLADRSLPEAVRSCLDDLAIRGGIQVESDLTADYRDFSNEVDVALFRILQEGLSNILRHSKSPAAFVSLQRVGDSAVLVVRDWGVGFDPARQMPGLGLGNMKERVGLLGGDLSIESTPEGTTVRVMVPGSKQNRA